MKIKIDVPNDVSSIIDSFERSEYAIFIVGGAVRDAILGRITNDWDFTTDATPEEILKIVKGGVYNNNYGTVFTENINDPKRPHEITTFRKEEGYRDLRHPDKITWGKTIEEDLARREATISAMALKRISRDNEFELIDPFGGYKDLKNKIFRAVGEANKRFQEDALRMMRAVRIAAQLNLTIEKETFEAIQDNAPLINKISKERIKEELFKLLASDYPYEGILLLKNANIVAEILPELEKCFGVEQKSPGRHHIYDVGTHSLMSLKYCKSKDPLVRFATLIHDIGKPQTYKKLDSGIITFYNHELVGTKIAERIADRLHFSKKERTRFVILVRWHQFTVDERQTDSAVRRFIRNVGRENIKDIMDLRVGDRLGGGARETSWRLEEFKKRLIDVQKEPFSLKDLNINGQDVMNLLKIKSGPKVGEILKSLFEKVEKKEIQNTKEELEREVKKVT